jgi:hypothetical protein
MSTTGVILDACVLANFSVCDTLIRLAEPPSLYEPRWSAEILVETCRVLESKLHWPSRLSAHFKSELLRNFPDSMVEGYESLTSQMPNQSKDRHVLAAAYRSGSPLILTFSLRDFHPDHTLPLGIRAIHPQRFLRLLLEQDEAAVLATLRAQASDRNRSVDSLLDRLSQTVPEFAAAIRTLGSRPS